MRSRGPGMLPSRDRASSYTGPPFLKYATVSRAAPPSGGSHRTVAVLRPHVCICVAPSRLAVWRTMRGGERRLDERGHVPVPLHVWLRGRL